MNKKILNAYDILDLKVDATIEEIKRAYRQKAKLYHPDSYTNKQEKKNAENEFKRIKAAYDYLIDIETQILTRELDDQNEFFDENFQFEFDQIKNEIKQQESILNKKPETIIIDEDLDHDEPNFNKSKTNHNNLDQEEQINIIEEVEAYYYEAPKRSTKNFEQLQNQAVEQIQAEIERRNIHILKVFDLLKHDKRVLEWDVGQLSSKVLQDWLIKEGLYRRFIKNSNIYNGYLEQQVFYEHLDKYATLSINPKLYRKKKFDEKLGYMVDQICDYCKGLHCDHCNYTGIIEKQFYRNIKVPINENAKAKFFEINNAGNQSPIVNGKLILTLKIDYNLKRPYELKVKKESYESFVPLLDACHHLKESISKIGNWITKHKQLTAIYLIAICLVIVVICLAVLL